MVIKPSRCRVRLALWRSGRNPARQTSETGALSPSRMTPTLLLLCQNYMPLCVRIGKLTRSGSNARSGEGSSCSSRRVIRFFLFFRHSKHMQTKKMCFVFLPLQRNREFKVLCPSHSIAFPTEAVLGIPETRHRGGKVVFRYPFPGDRPSRSLMLRPPVALKTHVGSPYLSRVIVMNLIRLDLLHHDSIPNSQPMVPASSMSFCRCSTKRPTIRSFSIS